MGLVRNVLRLRVGRSALNHHRLPLTLLTLSILTSLLASVSSAQLIRPQTQAETDAAPDRKEIDDVVNKLAAKLGAADPVGWAQSRNALTTYSSSPNDSPSFLDQYSDSIGAAMTPLARSADVRIRLNAAIVVARVAAPAAKAGSGKLSKVTQLLLKDSSDAVVLWATEAAHALLPALLQTGAPADLKDANAIGHAVALAAKAHLSEMLTEVSYRALLLDTKNERVPHSDAVRAIAPAALSAYLSDPLELYEFRAKFYDNAVPPLPQSDIWASTFFTTSIVWSAQSPAQQARTMAAMLGMLKGVSKQSAVAVTGVNVLHDVIKETGQSFHVIALAMNNKAMLTAADRVAGISSETPPEEIDARIGTLEQTVKDLQVGSTASK